MAGLNDRVSAERVHIGFFGVRNAGKSSVVNAVTGQKLSLVSDVKGTTTDPVQKAMEILPLGPVVIIDTPGIDDEGELGEMRVRRTKDVLSKTDVAVLVVDAVRGKQKADDELSAIFAERGIPHVTVYNKSDLLENIPAAGEGEIYVSAESGYGINDLRELLGHIAGKAESRRVLVGDLIDPGDVVVLVTPIDESAPKGGMILPQQKMISDVLVHVAINIVKNETELATALESLREPPRMVITDSQAFGKVSRIVPESITLTSFSILFARYKGDLDEAVRGAAALDRLSDAPYTDWEIETVRSIRELLKLFHRLLFTCADDEAAQLTSRTELQTLTPREMEIVNLLEQGITPANIAHILHITVPTTNRHIYNIYKKVNVNSRAELMAKIK